MRHPSIQENDVKPLAIQLYTVREQAAKDFIGTIKKVAEIGYAGVEPAGLYDHSPAEIRKLVEDLGMRISSNHQPWPTRDNLQQVIDVAGELGTGTVICGWGPDQFADSSTIKATAADANFIVNELTDAGLTVAVHNHYWEFDRLDGRLKYDIFLEMVPGLKCEIDTYWCANFGANDASEVVATYKHRTPLLHIKDGLFDKEAPQVPVGSGKMDIPGVIASADETVLEWLIVENDTCDCDMLVGADKSFKYLISNGLAEGSASSKR